MRRALLLIGLSALAACESTGGPGTDDPVSRVLAVTADQFLVEYTLPPVQETRRMPLQHGDTMLQGMVVAGEGGGFYAIEELGWDGVGPHGRLPASMVRYNAGWSVAARITAAALTGSDSLLPTSLTLTGNGQYLVVHRYSSDAMRQDLAVLDAQTLSLVRRISHVGGFVSPASGTSVIATRSTCQGGDTRLLWINVSQGVTTDSVSVPCGYSVRGADSPSRVYVRSQNLIDLHAFDGLTQQIVATLDSALAGPFTPVAAPEYLVLPGYGHVGIARRGTLAAVGSVPLSGGAGVYLADGAIDRASGDFVGLAICPGCAVEYRLVAVDLPAARRVTDGPVPEWLTILR